MGLLCSWVQLNVTNSQYRDNKKKFVVTHFFTAFCCLNRSVPNEIIDTHTHIHSISRCIPLSLSLPPPPFSIPLFSILLPMSRLSLSPTFLYTSIFDPPPHVPPLPHSHLSLYLYFRSSSPCPASPSLPPFSIPLFSILLPMSRLSLTPTFLYTSIFDPPPHVPPLPHSHLSLYLYFRSSSPCPASPSLPPFSIPLFSILLPMSRLSLSPTFLYKTIFRSYSPCLPSPLPSLSLSAL